MTFDSMPWDGLGMISELKGRAGTPLLLSPDDIAPGEPSDDNEGDPSIASPASDDSEESATTSSEQDSVSSSTRSATRSETTGTKSTESVTGTSKTSSESSSTDTATSTSPSISSSAAIPISSTNSVEPLSTPIPAVDDDSSSVQLSSLAYLVPIFLLIAITIGALIYRKCRARKRIDRESSTSFQSPAPAPRGVGWKEIRNSDTDEKDDIWNDDSDPDAEDQDHLKEQWRKVQFKESKSRPGLLDVSTTAGWLRSAAWKSARSINVDSDEVYGDGDGGSRGQRTVKLVTRSTPTYESLLPGEPGYTAGNVNNPSHPGGGGSSPGRFESLRVIRDSLSSMSLAPIAKRLERNKAPNTRKVVRHVPPPPEEPAWIRPRAASPVNILSPPSQPHFFFQPTPAQSMVLHRPEISDSDYTVSDTESLLSNMLPSLDKRSDIGGSGPAYARGQSSLGVDLDKTPTKASVASSSKSRNSPSRSPGKTPTTMRRSSAVRDLAKSTSVNHHKSGRTEKPLSPASMRKSRKQIKDEKARQRVETILQASWSDRALSSPSVSLNSLASPPDANGRFPGWASPGVEQVGGIQARLAMLKSIESGK